MQDSEATKQSISQPGANSEPLGHPLARSLHSRESEKVTNKLSKQSRRFLEQLHLPPDVSEYEYSGLPHLQEVTGQAYNRFITNRTQSPFVIFTNLPVDEFEQNEDNFFGRVDYNPNLQLLILTMVSFPYEVAAGVFGRLVDDRAKENDVRRILLPRGSTRTDTPDRWKQADKSWIPRELPPGRTTQWPSIAVEVGYSETREKLKSDMKFWLNTNNEVRMALSIDIKRPSGTIFITAWKRGAPIPPRMSSNPEPQATQEIKIERGKAGQKPHITGNSNLTIPFENIMLRRPGQGEVDFVISREDLLEVAEGVWFAMDNK
ncbi:uncharacterized protein BDCG_00415 [Blastomyces dermatitidis ER-3]|uniref:Uncharacterized protein n=2 Tax=Ajellomyces dermatitidis TaxID=5039 RepID=F2TB56_AJEDA|nr:uncharacterized protein BDCG_00415 [Blastomyces dermatitidis ER-3]EEQ83610.1 hypothetical protein BDCG_00415 [Blastomyces dermatitidis ER-3]EGE80469.1 hypothetical protein BDDG_03410 [Blastomyces dermatitidis ATCC 18188]